MGNDLILLITGVFFAGLSFGYYICGLVNRVIQGQKS
jgi:hypothetical protein